MPVKVIVQIKKYVRLDKTTFLAVKTIQLADSEAVYEFPEKLQPANLHPELFEIGTVKNGIIGIANVRNLKVSLPDAVKKLYFDEEDNVVFKNTYLDERPPERAGSTKNALSAGEPNLNENLIKILQSLGDCKSANQSDAQKEPDLSGIEKRMCLLSFSGRQSAPEWLADFESECARCNVTDSVAKVKCMRLFLSGTAREWHQATGKKLKETDYNAWRESFKTVFTDRGWSNVLYAYAYRYIDGSLVEYALKKESLLLDVEKTMSTTSRICHIIFGLPFNVSEKIDRELMTSTDQLVNELRRFESTNNQKKVERPKAQRTEKSAPPPANSSNSREKKPPCHMCEAVGRPNLHHPPHFCRNRDVYAKLKEANLTFDCEQHAEEPAEN